MATRTPKMSYWQDAPIPRNQIALFATTLEDRIPAGHPVRLLDEILDEFDWSDWESKYVGRLGKPPIHPSVLCKVLLYAMSRKIRSSRQIEYAVGHSIDFIWLASGRSIDHTTLSEFRRKHGEALKGIYKQMVQLRSPWESRSYLSFVLMARRFKLMPVVSRPTSWRNLPNSPKILMLRSPRRWRTWSRPTPSMSFSMMGNR